jgi:hypothetical protein
MREEKSAKTRTTSSKKYMKENPGYVDDTMVADLGGFKQAINTREDPAYKKILAKCNKGSLETFSGNSHPILTPKPDMAHDDFIECSRGKSKEPR